MKTSDSIKALAVALKEAQNEMGGAVKDSKNPFYKSNYADLTAVLKTIKEPLAKHGFSFCQFPISDEHGVGVCTRLMHSSGEWRMSLCCLWLNQTHKQQEQRLHMRGVMPLQVSLEYLKSMTMPKALCCVMSQALKMCQRNTHHSYQISMPKRLQNG